MGKRSDQGTMKQVKERGKVFASERRAVGVAAKHRKQTMAGLKRIAAPKALGFSKLKGNGQK